VKIWQAVFVIVIALSFPAWAMAVKLTAAEKAMLSQQCGVAQKDVDITDQLSEEAQRRLKAGLAVGCKHDNVVLFINARKYISLYNPEPTKPVEFFDDWDSIYLTVDEMKLVIAINKKLLRR
jgi:hypothetical protein